MSRIRVEIEWENQGEQDPHWLNADNVWTCLQAHCKNTKFEVREVGGVSDRLTASEALFGFCGWLTTQPDRTVMSGHDDAGRPADLVGLFCKANDLSEPREGWSHALVHPDSSDLPDIKTEKIDESPGFRWWFYNLAYLFIGRTRLWATVGPRILK